MMTVSASPLRRRASDAPAPRRAGPGVQPFLKWAGGKRQLLPALRPFYPSSFERYFEPFLGSGAVFFDLASRGILDDKAAVLSDVNRDVMGCYQALRGDVSAVVEALRSLATDHARLGKTHYYAIRDEQFNPRRAGLPDPSQSAEGQVEYPARLAAMLIYLNRTGYNGLFRVNRRGHFNVPVGRYDRPRICDEEMLRRVASRLQPPGVTLRLEPFEAAIGRARPGDFLYLDPPYAPVSRTARFTAYTAGGFADTDQRRLRDLVVDLAKRGCHVLLSNSWTPTVAALYDEAPEVREVGLRTYRVPARRAINTRATGRGPVAECLVSNIQPAT